MKIQIDLKSAVCGLIVGIVAMLAIGAGESSNPNGRFQVQVAPSANSEVRGYAVIIDTQTGETWGMDCMRDWRDNKADKFWGTK